ncbi:Exopolygalacturonase [Sesamum alatum]|uniref:Exopolygalacturonase n=1 Tax=Sesamum alatum TaxID=300844 RepID=A0AAE1XV16_9LAMI|nr:Exopolygalacturonase [Sesamum alatum]
MAILVGASRLIAACLVLGVACFTAINGVEAQQNHPFGARRSLLGGAIFDITKFEAKADGTTDNAMPIIRAWNAACRSPGAAKVVIPRGNFMAGEIVLAGPCSAQMTLEIQGTLLANPDPSTYTGGSWIMLQKVDNVVVTGGGTINGQGKNYWQYAGGDSPLPVSLVFQTVGNAKLYNLKFVDSMGFHSKVTDSHDVSVQQLRINAPADSPNTDGIHLSSSKNVNITDSVIGTGDDCISIGHGVVNLAIARITCGPGHGISIGSLGKRVDETNLKGVRITNCTLIATTNGARIKTYHDSPQITASDIVFQDIKMIDVKHPIIIDQHYNSKTKPGESKVKISNARFVNIKGSSTSPVAVTLNCSSAAPCEGIQLENIDLVPSRSMGPLTSACSHAKFLFKGIQNPKALANCV